MAGNYIDAVTTSCNPCGAGRFSDMPDADNCDVCEEGKVAVGPSTVVCESCPAGKFNNDDGENGDGDLHKNHDEWNDCIECEEGKYSSVPNSITCELKFN